MSQPTSPLHALVGKLRGLLDNGLVTGSYTLTLEELTLLVGALSGDGSISHFQNEVVNRYQADTTAMRETLVAIAEEMRPYVQRTERMPPGDLVKLYHRAMDRIAETRGGAHLLQRIKRQEEEVNYLKVQLTIADAKIKTAEAASDDIRSEVNHWKVEATTAKTQAAKEVADLQREIDALKAAGHTLVTANEEYFDNAQENHALAEGLERRVTELERQLERSKQRIKLGDLYAEVLQGVIAEMIEYHNVTQEEAEEHGWTP